MTATAGVLAALAQSSLQPEAQAFLAAVAEGEGGAAFNILYSGGILIDPSDPNVVTTGRWRYWNGPLTTFPTWKGARLKNGMLSTAAGIFQDTGTTFRDYASFGVTGFEPQDQIAFNWQLAQFRFAEHSSTALLSVLQGTNSDRLLINTYLCATWPGGCDTRFPKRYASNLAALQALPTPSTETLQITVSDQVGRVGSSTILLT